MVSSNGGGYQDEVWRDDAVPACLLHYPELAAIQAMQWAGHSSNTIVNVCMSQEVFVTGFDHMRL